MFFIREYVPANEIWPTATPHMNYGHKSGLVRGWNVEVKKHTGEVFWMSAVYIHEGIEEYVNSEFTQFYYNDLGVVPTGRICFRGYGIEEYDSVERETFITPCDSNGNVINTRHCVSA